MQIYALRDTKVAAFLAPFTAPNNEVAKRLVIDAMDNPESVISKHPEDFNLFCLGHFDEQTGEITGEKHVNLGFAPTTKEEN